MTDREQPEETFEQLRAGIIAERDDWTRARLQAAADSAGVSPGDMRLLWLAKMAESGREFALEDVAACLRFYAAGNEFLGWNPLDDSAQALELAMALDITISPGQLKPSVMWWRRPELIEQEGLVEVNGDDRMATVRRLITRAAAEIGRAGGGG